jgi:hypothetical protein
MEENIIGTLYPYIRPTLQYGGALTGGLLAAPTNFIAPGVGSAIGAGLGYAGGNQVADLIDYYLGKQQPKSIARELLEMGYDIPMGATLEMGGQIASLPIKKIGQSFRADELKSLQNSKLAQETMEKIRYTQEQIKKIKELAEAKKGSLRYFGNPYTSIASIFE